MTVELSSGRIVSVSSSNAGAGLDGDHASGVTELAVDDAGEFFESGGLLLIDGDTLTYTGIGGDDDEDTIIFLSAPTSNAYDDNSRVEVLPVTPTLTAQVVREGEGASEPAVVLHVLEAFLPLGIRDPDDQEFARLMTDREGDGWVVYDVRGKSAAILPGALPSDGGDLDPDEESVYLDGPPDFWTTSQYGASPYLTQSEMEAVADPVWVAAVAGLAFDNGTITFPTGTIPSNVSPKYYPVWLVPLAGRQCRVVIDSVTPGGGAEDQSAFATNTALQSDAHDFDDGWTETFWYLADVTGGVDVSEYQWRGYADYTSAPSNIQTPPLQSATQDESASIYYGAYTTPAPVQPLMAVTLFEPLADWQSAPFLSDAGCTVTGVRVVLL